MKNAKKKTSGLMIFSICLLIVAIATPVTLALFSDRKESTTQITFGKIEIDEGKTSVSVALDKLLPGDNVFEDKVIAAKDVFSESYIMRVKYTFTAAEADQATLQAYLDILGGKPFATVNGYGDINYVDENLYVVKDGAYVALYVEDAQATGGYRLATKADTTATYYVSNGTGYDVETGAAVRQPRMANGLVVKTQAVDASGKVYVSEYNAVTKTYTATDAQATVTDGYAKNYRWFYNEADEYFYLCNFFADDAAGADQVRIRNVERSNATKADSITVDGTNYDLTTKAGRDALVSYYDNTYVPSFTLKTTDADYNVVDGATNTQKLSELQAAAYDNNEGGVTSARESYVAALAEFNTAKAAYNEKYTAYATKKSEYTSAYSTFINEWNKLTAPTAEEVALKTAVDAHHVAVMAELNKEDHTSATVVETTALDAAINAVTTAGDYKAAAVALSTASGEAISKKIEVNNANMTAAKTALDRALITYQVAVTNFKTARDIVAAQMKDLQELYVFALDGDYNKIPLELTQIVKYVVATQDDIDAGNYVTEDGVNYKTDALGRKVVEQTNLQYDKTITLTMSFEAVQSANLRKDGATADLDLATATIADLVEFFPEANA